MATVSPTDLNNTTAFEADADTDPPPDDETSPADPKPETAENPRLARLPFVEGETERTVKRLPLRGDENPEAVLLAGGPPSTLSWRDRLYQKFWGGIESSVNQKIASANNVPLMSEADYLNFANKRLELLGNLADAFGSKVDQLRFEGIVWNDDLPDGGGLALVGRICLTDGTEGLIFFQIRGVDKALWASRNTSEGQVALRDVMSAQMANIVQEHQGHALQFDWLFVNWSE